MATRNVVPRENGQGGIGTTLKKWLNGFFVNLFADSIQTTNVFAVSKQTDDSYSYFMGSTPASGTGAQLMLSGKDHTQAGGFWLTASNGIETSQLIGTPAGALRWKGADIATNNNAIKSASIVSTEGLNSVMFSIKNNGATIFCKRGANAQAFVVDYWTADAVTLATVGSNDIAVVTKDANSNSVTITNISNSDIAVQIVTGDALL